MSEILDLRHMLAPSGLAHYIPNDVIQGHDPDDGIQMAAHIMVSERHGKFALVEMTAHLLDAKAALTARLAELDAGLRTMLVEIVGASLAHVGAPVNEQTIERAIEYARPDSLIARTAALLAKGDAT